MKHIMTALMCLALFFCACIPVSASAEDDFLRLHVRANSNRDADQALKLLVRDAILAETTRLLRDVSDKQAAMSVLSESFDILETAASKVIAAQGYGYGVRISIKNEFFAERSYDGFTLPEGMYDALIVEIGEGTGDNWWCVVYPAVCLSGAVNGEVRVDLDAVPEAYKTDTPQQNVRFACWIFEVIRDLAEKLF